MNDEDQQIYFPNTLASDLWGQYDFENDFIVMNYY